MIDALAFRLGIDAGVYRNTKENGSIRRVPVFGSKGVPAIHAMPRRVDAPHQPRHAFPKGHALITVLPLSQVILEAPPGHAEAAHARPGVTLPRLAPRSRHNSSRVMGLPQGGIPPPRSTSVPPPIVEAPLLAKPPSQHSQQLNRSRRPTTPVHMTYPGFDQVGRGTRRSDLLDRGFDIPDPRDVPDPFDENQPMAWQGTLLDTQHFDPALKPKTIARPTKSRHLWKRLNPGHMTQLWDTSQRVCQNDEQREEQMNQFAFNAHLRKTDINTYANAYARQYPRLDN